MRHRAHLANCLSDQIAGVVQMVLHLLGRVGGQYLADQIQAQIDDRHAWPSWSCTRGPIAGVPALGSASRPASAAESTALGVDRPEQQGILSGNGRNAGQRLYQLQMALGECRALPSAICNTPNTLLCAVNGTITMLRNAWPSGVSSRGRYLVSSCTS